MIIEFRVSLIRTYNIINKSKQIFYPLIKIMEKELKDSIFIYLFIFVANNKSRGALPYKVRNIKYIYIYAVVDCLKDNKLHN